MSILIKDIEMPKGADELRLIIHPNGQTIISEKTYYEETEAVELPPHGDLIDRNALGMTDFEIATCALEKGNPYKNGLEYLLSKIENAPTIIESETGKDEM